LFIDKKEIGDLLASAGAGKWQGRASFSFDLRRMESALEKMSGSGTHNCSLINNEILRVNVTDGTVARIFTTEGASFYIDSSGVRLPLSTRLTAKLPYLRLSFPRLRLQGADSGWLPRSGD